MPNQFDKQIVEEGYRNAVVKLSGSLDTSDVAEVPAISPADFSNNDPRAGRLTGFRVDHVTYSIGNAIEVLLEWNSNSPQQITPVAGRGKINISDDGGLIPNTLLSGYDGTINLRTSGFAPGISRQNFTILLRLIKLYSG